MSKLKLYWVTVESSEDENCFVIAKNSRQAAALEEDYDGFDSGDAKATLVMPLSNETEQKILKEFEAAEPRKEPWPAFATPRILRRHFGAQELYLDGCPTTRLLGKDYVRGSFESIYGGRPRLIQSIAGFLKSGIYRNRRYEFCRGQRDAAWVMRCGIDRRYRRRFKTADERTQFERSLLESFKRRSQSFLANYREIIGNGLRWLNIMECLHACSIGHAIRSLLYISLWKNAWTIETLHLSHTDMEHHQ